MNSDMLVTGKVSKCKYCNADILWVKSKKSQKFYPIDAEWHYPNEPGDIQTGNKTHYHKCNALK
jgi:hypothetical protein